MTYKNNNRLTKNKKLILTTITSAIFVISMTLTGINYNIQMSSSDEGDVKGTWPPPAGQPSTGIPHIVAMKITPRGDDVVHVITENQMKVGASWLDKARTMVGEKALVTPQEVEQFFSATADGNTDFKVIGPDGQPEYYRLYFVEVP